MGNAVKYNKIVSESNSVLPWANDIYEDFEARLPVPRSVKGVKEVTGTMDSVFENQSRSWKKEKKARKQWARHLEGTCYTTKDKEEPSKVLFERLRKDGFAVGAL